MHFANILFTDTGNRFHGLSAMIAKPMGKKIIQSSITVLMLTPEFPPFITGGLGMACHGLVKALLRFGIKILLLLPKMQMTSKQEVEETYRYFYFTLTLPEDADTLGDKVTITPVNYRNHTNVKSNQDINQKYSTGLYINYEKIPGSKNNLLPDISTDKNIPANNRNDEKPPNNFEGNKIAKTNAYNHGSYSYPAHGYIIEEARIYECYTKEISSNLDFDIIHAHDWFSYPAGLRIKHESGKPLICHVHSTEYDRRISRPGSEILAIEKNAFLEASKIIAVSEYTARRIEDYYGIENKKIEVVHNATPNIKIHHKIVPKRPLRVSFIGRLTEQKAPMKFIEISEMVLSNNEKLLRKSGKPRAKLEFVIAGEG